MKSLSIIGFGTFGQFIAPYLRSYYNVYVWNRTDYKGKADQLGVQWSSIENCLTKDIIILCTNIAYFEDFLKKHGSQINSKAIVLDVASIKMKPMELMYKYLPSTCEIIGTHPLFGPQSGKNGIEGLSMVVCGKNTVNEKCLVDFLSKELKLKVTLMTPEEHDRQMAYAQGLTHFVGRAIHQMQIPESEPFTKAYKHLLDIKTMLGGDSWDLFLSIQNENPYAKEIRKAFIDQLNDLEQNLKQ
ncbi:MAG: prephenate dehydrogenase/arogenate dehydrogenase family protein [Bacteroidota bacterium]|nr:prephenate dehydrogenase/arogenate dehydrogenase family protein [Bacteroidota bacterium]